MRIHCELRIDPPPMTYSESARGLRVTRERALREIADHGVFHPDDIADFFAMCGDREFYDAEDVLEWLGY